MNRGADGKEQKMRVATDDMKSPSLPATMSA
jgi:hypothetical protein